MTEKDYMLILYGKAVMIKTFCIRERGYNYDGEERNTTAKSNYKKGW